MNLLKKEIDLDNYLKPIIDGIGTGMFGSKEAVENKERFNPPDPLFYFISAIKIILPNNDQQERVEYWIYEFNNLRELYLFAAEYFS